MLPLYPDIKPYKKQHIKIDNIHKIYVEETGNPDGIPVIHCHGGPGGQSNKILRRILDPEHFRIILFDQRGCGLSTPSHCLEANTTQDLIADIEVIRDLLQINKFYLAGGGWGSTLSLLYAQQNPEKIEGLILWSICLLRQKDIDWIYNHGLNKFFPECWQDFINIIPATEHDNIIAAYHRRLTGNDDFIKMQCAKRWAAWEAQCATLHFSKDILNNYTDLRIALNLALMSSYYFQNKVFLDENQILNNIDSLKNTYIKIIHGRYDMLSPLENAYLVYKQCPRAELQVIRDAGHAVVELGIVDALVKAGQDIIRKDVS